ncbi:uncharacterized protein EV422DRAFT_533168 [Fimicolochytrium jonesii]|uniref:uncharacterized protein n=1 Tax=Fimicolochytrium jonesii TaxID=1396493 RepID=UPI0022FDD8E0|nr:uncharacterized protein EV422DRAFT_533168 [Fimicolochytrium jonesii]KAI8820003.1 hypothetical protein EV422DRAFT_533168 [Fimicolochytrium jonesii]
MRRDASSSRYGLANICWPVRAVRAPANPRKEGGSATSRHHHQHQRHPQTTTSRKANLKRSISNRVIPNLSLSNTSKMLFQTVLASAALLSAAANAAPASPARADSNSSCAADWVIRENTDWTGVADLPNHPVWDKKFPDACSCANAILTTAPSGSTIPAAIFVWNSATQGCYPKGFKDVPVQLEGGRLHMAGWNPAKPGTAFVGEHINGLNVVNQKCTRFLASASQCNAICEANAAQAQNQDDPERVCDVAYAYTNMSEDEHCRICTFDQNQGQTLGFRIQRSM